MSFENRPTGVSASPAAERVQQLERRPRRAVVQCGEVAQVLECRQLQEVIRCLERHADPLVVIAVPVVQWPTEYRHLALVRLEHADEHLLRRRLARTARSEKAEDLAALYSELETGECRSAAAGIREPEARDIDHCAPR
jgi:hypothetical protein